MTLLEKIQNLCKEDGITLAALERKSGLSRGSIRLWDKNTPSADKIVKVANYFKVSSDFLLNENYIEETKQNKVINKLIDETKRNVFKWISFNNKFGNYNENELLDAFDLKENEKFILNQIIKKTAFFTEYNDGGYLIANLCLDHESPKVKKEIELYVWYKSKFNTYARNNFYNNLNDLYKLVINQISNVDEFIDEFLDNTLPF